MRSLTALVTVLVACAALALVIVGCLGKPRFECASNTDCNEGGAGGTCQPDNLCSFPDSSCPSGQRYGDLSGAQANKCVGVMIDALIPDAPPDAYVHDARECFGGGGAYQLCFAMMPPMGALGLSGSFNTDTDTRCIPMPASWLTAGQPDSCLLLGKTVTIANTQVQGTKPLVILGDVITINGTLDVASHAGTTGPGAPSSTCGAFPQAPAPNTQGAGGGAGGSFRTIGGNGGNGDNGTLAGTAAPAVGVPAILRAGCSGQVGGVGQVGSTPGAPGRGGGAVFLTASKIVFGTNGAINASGSGGIASNQRTGGSGGGSGGMIVMHAAETITGAPGAKILANGGGGASGASNDNAGASGNDPNVGTPTTPAAGGDAAGNNDGPGGDGFAGGTAAQIGTGANGARNTGGGGGGGGGHIQANVSFTQITSSPAATIVP